MDLYGTLSASQMESKELLKLIGKQSITKWTEWNEFSCDDLLLDFGNRITPAVASCSIILHRPLPYVRVSGLLLQSLLPRRVVVLAK